MTILRISDAKKFGTVGAVALDSWGNLAAATSTGGMTNMKFGRVGDSPIIGAGTTLTIKPALSHAPDTVNTLYEPLPLMMFQL